MKTNKHFYIGGQKFRFVGGNYYPLVWSSKSTVQSVFDACRAKGITVVRAWCFDSGKMPTNSAGNFRYLSYPVGENLITNSSFETNTDGWVLGADYTRVDTDSEDGSYSIKQVSTSGYSSLRTDDTGITVLANTEYIFTYWHKTTTTAVSDAVAFIKADTPDGTTIKDCGYTNNTEGEWSIKQVIFNTGNHTKIFISFVNWNGATTNYFDNISISLRTAAGENIITNGSFETNTTGWTADSGFSRSNEDAYDGSYSIKQVTTSGYNNFTTVNDGNGIAVEANKKYKFSVRAKITINSGNPPRIYINAESAYGRTITSKVLSSSAGAWVEYTFNFWTGDDEKIWIRLQNYNGNVTAYYDSFSIGLLPTPYLANREATFANLDMVLDEARTRGIKLILSLADNNPNYNTKNTYVNWANSMFDAGLSTSFPNIGFFNSEYCKDIYKENISTFVNRVNTINGLIYKNDPTIFAWELGNELRLDRDDPSGINTLNSANLALLSKPGGWIDEMSTFIKEIDPNHLIGFSSQAHHWSWVSGDSVANGTYYGVDYNLISALPNIDYLDFHCYPTQVSGANQLQKYGQHLGYPNAVSGEGFRAQLKDYIDVGHANGKPVIIGEIGMVKEVAPDTTYYPLYPRHTAFENYFADFFDLADGGDGIIFWSIVPTTGGGTYSVNLGDTGGEASTDNSNDTILNGLIATRNSTFQTTTLSKTLAETVPARRVVT